MIDMYGSIERVPETATGDDRLYGVFPDQIILGCRATTTVERIADLDARALDELGFPSFQVGGSAIHISGVSPFGQKTEPGTIKALGIKRIQILDPVGPNSAMGGTGFENNTPVPTPVAIVSWDYCGERWLHQSHFRKCDGFVTLLGVHRWCMGCEVGSSAFGPSDIAAAIDSRENRLWNLGEQQKRAVRRLLDFALKGGIEVEGCRLARSGRHGFRWSKDAPAGGS